MKIPLLNNPEEFKETVKSPILNKIGRVTESAFTKEINKKLINFFNQNAKDIQK